MFGRRGSDEGNRGRTEFRPPASAALPSAADTLTAPRPPRWAPPTPPHDDAAVLTKLSTLDPIEGITTESAGKDYFEVMRSNLTALQQGLGCS